MKKINLYKPVLRTFVLTASGTSFVDEEIKIIGKKLIVKIENANSTNFYLRINDINQTRIKIDDGFTYIGEFNRVYFTGSVNGSVYFITLEDEEQNLILPKINNWGGRNAEYLSAGNSLNITGKCIGIYIETFGNLVVNFGGSNITFSNVPAGTLLPISPSAIVNTTTSNIIIIYCDSYYSI